MSAVRDAKKPELNLVRPLSSSDIIALFERIKGRPATDKERSEAVDAFRQAESLKR